MAEVDAMFNQGISFSAKTSTILHQMNSVLDLQSPDDTKALALVQQMIKLEAEVAAITSAHSQLHNRCVLLSKEMKDVQRMGDGRYWRVKPEKKKEFSFQMLSSLPKRMMTNTPFSLRLRVIDRVGVSRMLRRDDVFELKVASAQVHSTVTGTSTLDVLPKLLGLIRVCPSPNHEVEFRDVVLVMESMPLGGIKVYMTVVCTSQAEIQPLELEPVLVKPHLAHQPRKRLRIHRVDSE